MPLSQADKAYINTALKPLVRTDQINGLEQKLIKKITELEAKIADQQLQIDNQKDKLAEQDKRITNLESISEMRKATIETLKLKSDDNESYSRRESVRIHGIAVSENESNSDILKIVEKCTTSLGLTYNASEIARAHRIGKPTLSKDGKTNLQSIIVKYKHFDAKKRLFNARPRGKREQRSADKQFSVSVDLTQRKYKLLEEVRTKATQLPSVDFVFADVNCSLGMKSKNGLQFFKTIEEFNELVTNIQD